PFEPCIPLVDADPRGRVRASFDFIAPVSGIPGSPGSARRQGEDLLNARAGAEPKVGAEVAVSASRASLATPNQAALQERRTQNAPNLRDCTTRPCETGAIT